MEYASACHQYNDAINIELRRFSDKICQRIEDALAKGFSLSDKLKLACAIRWRVDEENNGDEENNRCCYPTFGRSKKLSSRVYSEINGDAKLVNLIKNEQNKVILLKNVAAQDIVDDNVWDGGDADFSDTIGSILIFPIWYRIEHRHPKEWELLGILYFTSKAKDSRCPFVGHIGYREFGAALADIYIGTYFSSTL